MAEEIARYLEVETAIKGAIKNQKLLLAFNWALLVVSSLFFVTGIYSLYQTTSRGSGTTRIPIGIYLMIVLIMFVINVFNSVVQMKSLIQNRKGKSTTKREWLHALVPILTGAFALAVLGFEGYRFLCLNKTVSKLSRPLAIFKLLISATVVIQSGAMIWRLKNPFV